MNALGTLYRVTQGDSTAAIAQQYLIPAPTWQETNKEIRRINGVNSQSKPISAFGTLEIPRELIRPDVELVPSDLPDAFFFRKKAGLFDALISNPSVVVGVAALGITLFLKRKKRSRK